MSSETLPILITIYFLPTLVGCVRAKADGRFDVVMVNPFLGWAVLGWLGTFQWAPFGPHRRRHPPGEASARGAACGAEAAPRRSGHQRAAGGDNAKIIIWAALAVAVLGIAPAHAQNSTTNCYRFGNGTMCETRDHRGRTVQRTQCWPAGRGNVTCQTRDNPNGYDLAPLPRGFLLDDGARLPQFPL